MKTAKKEVNKRKVASVEPAESETTTTVMVIKPSVGNAKREPIPSEEVAKVKDMPRNIQCFLLRRSFSIGQTADALGIKASSVPTNAKAGEKALAKIKGLASVVSAIPE